MKEVAGAMRADAARRGFTLMEMMIALLLGAVIITPLYIVTRGMSIETTRRQMGTEAMQRARLGLELLAADFQRAGMMVSPAPERDPDSIVEDDQHAFHRQAVVHLNRDGSATFDAVLIVGNLVTSNTYTGIIDDSGIVSLNEPFQDDGDCLREFNPNYAFAHLTTSTGQTLDARVEAVDCDGSAGSTLCALDLEDGELILEGPGGFAAGQQIFVQANQAALYRVESVTPEDPPAVCNPSYHRLVRYFIDYDGTVSGELVDQDCSLAEIDDATMLDKGSARVIAEYVTDFQVWFRTVRAGGTGDLRPNYHGISSAAGLVPDEATPIYGESAEAVAGAGHLSCLPTAGSHMGPEHVRSAVIRLAVRTEMPDPQVREAEFGDAGVARFNVDLPPADDPLCVGMYKVRTLTTEVAMPNLAARVATFSEVPEL